MKRFTLIMIVLLTAVLAQAAGPMKFKTGLLPKQARQETPVMSMAKPAPMGLTRTMPAKARAPKKAVAAVSDLAGDYIWSYETASDLSTDLESLETTAGERRVTITVSKETENTIIISGMIPGGNDLEATVDMENGNFVIDYAQVAYTSDYGDCNLMGYFYYEGDETYKAGWYSDNIYGFFLEDGSIYLPYWMGLQIAEGQYAGYTLGKLYVKGSTFTPVEPLVLVEAPEGLETSEYLASFLDSDGEDANCALQIGFDGNDVYIQGFSQYLPEAWLKGTLADGVVTIAGGQYLGIYASYETYFMDDDAILAYDEATSTFSLPAGNIYSYLGSYSDRVMIAPITFTKVTEKAGTPATPTISGIEVDSYGDDYLVFNIPLTDIDGNGLVSSKLTYQFFYEAGGTVSPLTFLADDYQYLENDMTVLPYGFSEDWDFYPTSIYLNMDHSTWDKIGVQSTYTGGGETHQSEVFWYTIPRPITLPEGVATATYKLVATEYSMVYDDEEEETEEEPTPSLVKEDYFGYIVVGFDNKDVYMQGFSTLLPNAWVKGVLSEDGKTITVPVGQYMGTYESYFGDIPLYFMAGDMTTGDIFDAVFQYDAENGKITSMQQIVVSQDAEEIYTNSWFEDIDMTLIKEVAATPADPKVVTFNYTYTAADEEDEDSYSLCYIDFDIPAVDTDGNDLNVSKLYYMIMIDNGKTEYGLTLTTKLYEYLEENMKEIPYLYTDDYDIYQAGERVWLNQSEATILGWKRIGIKSIYYGGGETHESNTDWFDLVSYFNPPVGITTNTANAQTAQYFDLQGRALTSQARGLTIKRMQMSDGSVKTVKIVRK